MQPSTRVLLAVSLWLAALVPGPTAAAPIARTADVTLSVGMPFVRDAFFPYGGNPSFISATATGVTVSVDPDAGSVSLAAGLVSRAGPVVVPVTGNTSVNALAVSGLANAAGTFFVGGAAGVANEPPCPVTPGAACVQQTSFGGTMGVDGTLDIQLLAGVVTLPIDLAALGLGQGATGVLSLFSSTVPVDAAPWTIAGASVQIPGTTLATHTTGGATASGFRLVSPTYLGLGIPGTQVVYGILDVQFTDGLGLPPFVLQVVPEPDGLVLLAFGAALLLAQLGPRREAALPDASSPRR